MTARAAMPKGRAALVKRHASALREAAANTPDLAMARAIRAVLKRAGAATHV